MTLEEQTTSTSQLIDKGWEQGALFSALSIPIKLHNSDTNFLYYTPNSDEKFVVVSQTCDITASIDKEPYIEAILCKQVSIEELPLFTGNSARTLIISHRLCLVAHAKYKVLLAKEFLSTIVPEPWPNDDGIPVKKLADWIARRYNRPALPDKIVDLLQKPLCKTIGDLLKKSSTRELGNRFNKIVKEIRAEMPSSPEEPIQIRLILIVEDENLSDEKQDIIDQVIRKIQEKLISSRITLTEITPITYDLISVTDYKATIPIYLEYMTYRGSEVIGSEPTIID